MKHPWKVTLVLLGIFLLAQFIGIGVMYKYIDTEKTLEAGKTVFKDLPIGERPPLEEKTSFVYVLITVLIGTGILFLIIRYKAFLLWRVWFLIAVVLSLTVAWGAFITENYAWFLALAFGLWKIFKPGVFVQNFTEVFIYGGLAAIFAPLFNLWSVVVLLLLISVYDMYAVWKSKHMIKMAKSQMKAKIFAGLLIPTKLKMFNKKIEVKGKTTYSIKEVPKKKARTAMLGGGDIGFPLIFTGVVLKAFGLWASLIIPFFSGAALLVLLLKGKEKKFYPAMPLITLGCLLGLGVVWVVGLV